MVTTKATQPDTGAAAPACSCSETTVGHHHHHQHVTMQGRPVHGISCKLEPAEVQQIVTANGRTEQFDPALTDRLADLRREHVDHLTIFVGAGTCGLGAGAGKMLTAVKQYVAEHELDAEIIEVGCIGMCSAEPLLDIQVPGRTRLMFGKVMAKDAPKIISNVLEDSVPQKHLIGQFRDESADAWGGVPFVDEHPFFADQVRRVLANCGIVNPSRLDEYIARGGYQA
ncbi:MAG: hypothetical protein ACOC0P_02510, partial [Planctomycetota bacterium]